MCGLSSGQQSCYLKFPQTTYYFQTNTGRPNTTNLVNKNHCRMTTNGWQSVEINSVADCVSWMEEGNKYRRADAGPGVVDLPGQGSCSTWRCTLPPSVKQITPIKKWIINKYRELTPQLDLHINSRKSLCGHVGNNFCCFVTSTLVASEDVLMMSPTTYFLIPKIRRFKRLIELWPAKFIFCEGKY